MTLSIASVPGIRVGHWTNLEAATGCTVVLCEHAAAVGVDVRGAAPGTRETDVLRPGRLAGRAHAILLTGGSAFGLDAATGVMRFLEEHEVGFQTSVGRVPIVSGAVVFDLGIGRADVRPDAAAGYAACEAASASVGEGCVGAGTGATVAKLGGPTQVIKSGIGTAGRELSDGTRIGALVVVNAVGNVYDPWSGEAITTSRASRQELSTLLPGTNTTIGVIATTAQLDSSGVNRLAMLGHDGLAMAIRPAHTLYDGDTLFAVSLPSAEAKPAEPVELGQAAAEVVAEAIVRAVRAATTLHGVPAAGR